MPHTKRCRIISLPNGNRRRAEFVQTSRRGRPDLSGRPLRLIAETAPQRMKYALRCDFGDSAQILLRRGEAIAVRRIG